MSHPAGHRRRAFWWSLLCAIIGAGVLSRLVRTGHVMVDKYLGDALYAAMVYVLLRLTGRVWRVALWAGIAMLAIELLQLTGIAEALLRSDFWLVRIGARLLGTHFSVFDLLSYAVGIGCIAGLDRALAISRPGNGGD